jgi:hypothetical protein
MNKFEEEIVEELKNRKVDYEDLINVEVKLEDYMLKKILEQISILEELLKTFKSDFDFVRKHNYICLTSNDNCERISTSSFLIQLEYDINYFEIAKEKLEIIIKRKSITKETLCYIFEKDFKQYKEESHKFSVNNYIKCINTINKIPDKYLKNQMLNFS